MKPLARVLATLWLLGCTSEPRRENLAHGRFEQLQLVVPSSPRSVALLLADRAEQSRADALSAQLVSDGAIVTRIDAEAFLGLFDATPSSCAFASGDLDNLARFIQAYLHRSTYEPAILIGLGAGAGLAAAALMQGPAQTFAGAIVFDFCGSTRLRAPLCPGDGLRIEVHQAGQTFTPTRSPVEPLLRLSSSGNGGVCPPGTPAAYAPAAQGESAFRAAVATLTAAGHARATSSPNDLGDIPIVEVPSQGPGYPDTFGVFMSGDGGWAGFDKDLSNALAERGLPIVGIDSLRYFWRARTPEGTAADLERVIQHYQTVWSRQRVVLLGFSQGADVLPFVVNRLAAKTRPSIVGAIALSISTTATFEFHVKSWVGAPGDRATLPELLRLAHGSMVCIYGKEDQDAVCPRLDPKGFRIIELPGDHHFDGDYQRLSRIVLDSLETHQ